MFIGRILNVPVISAEVWLCALMAFAILAMLSTFVWIWRQEAQMDKKHQEQEKWDAMPEEKKDEWADIITPKRFPWLFNAAGEPLDRQDDRKAA